MKALLKIYLERMYEMTTTTDGLKLWKEDPSYYVGDTLHNVKQEKIQQAMSQNGLDGLLLTKAEAVRYATDFYVKGYRPFIEPEYLTVIPKGGKPIVGHTSGSDNYRIQIRSDIQDHRKLPGVNQWPKEIIKILKDYGLTSGVIGTDFLPFHLHAEIIKELPNIEFIDISTMWVDLTVIKHPIEIEILKEATAITEIGLNAAINAVKPGVREYEVAAEGEYQMRKHGSEMTPFITNVASGVNCAIFERISTDKRIRDGEMVILDIGCVWRGYTGDLGRTICLGEPSDTQKDIYRVNHLALQEAIKAVKPGVTCGDIDAAARQVIRDAGYGKYEHKFSTGHQLGYGLHGEPAINKNVDFVLQPGMVMAIEPRITFFDKPEIGGVHLEDAVLVTDNGFEKISKIGYDEKFLK